MKVPTPEEISNRFPRLTLDEHFALSELVGMYPDIESFPDKRLEYEATHLAKEHLCKKGLRGLSEKAKQLVSMACELIPVHEAHRDTHPDGAVAFDEGEGFKSNPFVRFTRDNEKIILSHKDNERWTRDWRAREREVKGSNKPF